MDFGAALTDMWRAILLFVPKAVGFIAILLIGFVIARLLRRGVKRLLERLGFDRAVRRGGITRFLANSRHDASGIVAMLAYYTVLLFTLQLAFGIWGPNPVSDLIAAVVAWLPRAIVAIVIVVVAAAVASAVKDVVSNALSSLSYGRLLANLAAVFIVGLGVIAALNQIGIATTVTTPVLITVLATIGGILVVGVGGGMIGPMQQRWERWLSKAENESTTVREKIHAYAESRREAMEAEAAARREVENAPAVGMQPVDTTYASGKAQVPSPLPPSVQPPVPSPAQSRVPEPRTERLTDSQVRAAAAHGTERLTDSQVRAAPPRGTERLTDSEVRAAAAQAGQQQGPTAVIRPSTPWSEAPAPPTWADEPAARHATVGQAPSPANSSEPADAAASSEPAVAGASSEPANATASSEPSRADAPALSEPADAPAAASGTPRTSGRPAASSKPAASDKSTAAGKRAASGKRAGSADGRVPAENSADATQILRPVRPER